ncbi:MAG: ABC transporter ATP-binding protein [Clostridiaceae bacterium]|nr:ABC transporter ATP-binding protein [Clostridiaceae bacterium]
MEELLRLEHLSVEYKVRDGYLSAVRDINLTLEKGEVLAIVGESGCGKSTVAHAIMRLLPMHNERITGRVLFRGEDLVGYTDRQMVKIRGKEIGMIFQNPLDSLNPVYRAGDQVEEAILLDGKNRREARNETFQLFSEVRMPDPEKQMQRFPHELSGGMRQRVMIAMMLSRYPGLLIADEPTTALDVTIEAQIMDILLRLKQERSTSVLLITHNFGIVSEAADRVAVMYAGQLVEQGTVYEIFDNPVHPYTRLLMQALPRRPKTEGRLQTIEGSVPRLTEVRQGCRFANRCPLAEARCTCEDPPANSLGGTHIYNCHLGEEARAWTNR